MKIPLSISAMAAVVFLALGVASVLLDLEVRRLRIDAGNQAQQLYAAEARNAETMQALQALEEKRERLEMANQNLRKEVSLRQSAVQMQAEQINQGTIIAQQIAPNLLHDMAEASVKNDKMRQLLLKHGYNVQAK